MAVLESWAEAARDDGDEEEQARVAALMPKRVKKRRALAAEDGTNSGWEEYYDYIYPEEQAAQPSLKILEMAHKWKKQKEEQVDD